MMKDPLVDLQSTRSGPQSGPLNSKIGYAYDID